MLNRLWYENNEAYLFKLLLHCLKLWPHDFVKVSQVSSARSLISLKEVLCMHKRIMTLHMQVYGC